MDALVKENRTEKNPGTKQKREDTINRANLRIIGMGKGEEI